jgi:hypothetical protein
MWLLNPLLFMVCLYGAIASLSMLALEELVEIRVLILLDMLLMIDGGWLLSLFI